jgi:hypothetical protein
VNELSVIPPARLPAPFADELDAARTFADAALSKSTRPRHRRPPNRQCALFRGVAESYQAMEGILDRLHASSPYRPANTSRSHR